MRATQAPNYCRRSLSRSRRPGWLRSRSPSPQHTRRSGPLGFRLSTAVCQLTYAGTASSYHRWALRRLHAFCLVIRYSEKWRPSLRVSSIAFPRRHNLGGFENPRHPLVIGSKTRFAPRFWRRLCRPRNNASRSLERYREGLAAQSLRGL